MQQVLWQIVFATWESHPDVRWLRSGVSPDLVWQLIQTPVFGPLWRQTVYDDDGGDFWGSTREGYSWGNLVDFWTYKVLSAYSMGPVSMRTLCQQRVRFVIFKVSVIWTLLYILSPLKTSVEKVHSLLLENWLWCLSRSLQRASHTLWPLVTFPLGGGKHKLQSF